MAEWKNCINKVAGNDKIEDLTKYFKSVDNIYQSPIDKFYIERDKIIVLGNQENTLNENDVLGGLLFVGIISATENYIREIFSECIKICPICKKLVVNNTMLVGAVIWNHGKLIEKSIFENLSFSDNEQIKKSMKNSLNIDIKQSELLFSLLNEYEKLCQMRHAIVHSSRDLAGRNAIKMNIFSKDDCSSVKIGYAELQECASICTSLICEMNNYLFVKMAERWAVKWKKDNLWNEDVWNKSFDMLWDAFCSKIV